MLRVQGRERRDGDGVGAGRARVVVPRMFWLLVGSGEHDLHEGAPALGRGEAPCSRG